MADPLQLCRQFNIDKRLPGMKDGFVTFDTITFLGSDDTNFRKTPAKKPGETSGDSPTEKPAEPPKPVGSPFYSIAAIAFFLRQKNAKFVEYLRSAGAEQLEAVNRVDRKVLLDYLNGSIQDCEQIDKFAPLATPVQRPSSAHAPSSASSLLSGVAPTDIRHVTHLSTNNASSAAASRRAFPNSHHHALPTGSTTATASSGVSTLRPDNKFGERISGGANAAGGGISQAISTSRIAELKAKLQKRKLETTKTVPGDDVAVLSSTVKREDLSAPDREQRELSRLISRLGRQYTDRKSVLHIQSSQTNWSDVMAPLVLQLRTNLEGGPSAHHQPLQHAASVPGGVTQNSVVSALGPAAAMNSGGDNKAAVGMLEQQQAASDNVAAALKKARTDNADAAGYSRYDQERFMGVNAQDIGFQFDPMATYSTMNKGLKASTLGGNMPAQPYGAAGSIGVDKRYLGGGVRPSARSPGGGGGGVPKSPIIIIPNISNSLMSIQNAREILEELRYVSPENVKRDGHAVENDTIVIHHRDRAGENSTSYKITNNPARISPEDWPRVVAAFVQGQTWQFKGWPWPSPVEIFNNIRGFHLKWDDMSLDPNIAKWNVQVIELSRSKRHLDKAAILKFWDFVERSRQRGGGPVVVR